MYRLLTQEVNAAVLAAKQCGAENVFSYEANPVMEPLIRKNFELNGWKPNLVMKAVTVDGEDVRFFASDNVYSSSTIDRSETVAGKMITVPSDSINHVIEDTNPNTIVMDVEGAEAELLTKADLSTITNILVEVHPHIIGTEAIEELKAHLMAESFELVETAHKTLMYVRQT